MLPASATREVAAAALPAVPAGTSSAGSSSVSPHRAPPAPTAWPEPKGARGGGTCRPRHQSAEPSSHRAPARAAGLAATSKAGREPGLCQTNFTPSPIPPRITSLRTPQERSCVTDALGWGGKCIRVPRGFVGRIWAAPRTPSGWVFWKAPADAVISSSPRFSCSSWMTEPFSLCRLHALVLVRISTASPTHGSARQHLPNFQDQAGRMQAPKALPQHQRTRLGCPRPSPHHRPRCQDAPASSRRIQAAA